jgi:hypothetical protein
MVVVTEILLRGVRESSSHADADSASKSDDSSNGKGLDTQGRIQKHKDHSQKDGNFEALHFFVVFVCNLFYPASYFIFCL